MAVPVKLQCTQTIFSMRARVATRVHGLIIAAAEFSLFALPISVVQFLPKFYFASLLMVFGIEITADWLFYSYTKVPHALLSALGSTEAHCLQYCC